ncbi:PREDICTED: putative SWI/SNF-related matrix-associated actin-dependent regulator of chromatin, partial [Prunus dulcis]
MQRALAATPQTAAESSHSTTHPQVAYNAPRTDATETSTAESPLPNSHKGSKPNSQVKKEDPDCKVTSVQQTRPKNLEDGDFPTEQDWLLVGRTFVTALSTSKGRKLFDNEIVHFSFPSANSSYKTRWIVRFSTKQFGQSVLFRKEKHRQKQKLNHAPIKQRHSAQHSDMEELDEKSFFALKQFITVDRSKG